MWEKAGNIKITITKYLLTGTKWLHADDLDSYSAVRCENVFGGIFMHKEDAKSEAKRLIEEEGWTSYDIESSETSLEITSDGVYGYEDCCGVEVEVS